MCHPGRPRPQGESHHVSSPVLVRLPEREVAGVFLERVRLLLLDLVRPLAGQATVLGEARDPEVHVPLDRVCVVLVDQRLDERDDLRHDLAGLRHVVRLAEAEAARVLEVPLGRAGCQLGAGAGGGLVDLVVDVGDVVHQRHVVSLRPQPGAQPHPEHEGPRVADVGPRVDGRSADVHPDRPGRLGQLVEPARVGVIEPHRACARSRRAGAPRSRRRARGRARGR